MKNQLVNSLDVSSHPLRDAILVMFKHKVLILIVFTLIVIVSLMTASLSKPLYAAKSTVLVKIGREYMVRPEMGTNNPMMALGPEGIINSEIQILTSRELAEKVIDSLGISNIYPEVVLINEGEMQPVDAAVKRFADRLVVSAVKKSNVIEVSFEHKNPAIAAAAVNKLIDVFKEKHLKVFSEPQGLYLEQQLKDSALKLAESENHLESFKRANRVYSLEEQRNLLFRQRIDLDTVLKSSSNNISEVEGKIAAIRGQLRDVANDGSMSYGLEREKIINEAKSKLLGLQISEQDLLRKYSEDNRLVVNLRKQIDLVSLFLKEQEQAAKAVNPLQQELRRELLASESTLKSLNMKVISLKNQVKSIDSSLDALNRDEQRLSELKRDNQMNEKEYQSYRERAQEARRLDDMNRLKLANISVIQAAIPPSEPAVPKQLIVVVVGILTGVLLGVGSALIVERCTKTLSTPDQVERILGINVLMSIPYQKG